jgi:glycosyltransferase involved in cell wall biosynthesis
MAEAARRLIETRFDSHRQARTLAALEDGRPLPAAGDLSGRRIAYVCVDPGVPVFGTKGASVHVQEVVRELESRGARVTLFAARVGEDRPADLADTELVHVPVRADGADAAARERAQAAVSASIAHAVAAGGFDLVYERCSLFSTVLAQLAEAGVPGILEVNAPLIDEQRTHRVLVDEAGARECLIRQAGAAARTIAVSEPVADWVRGLAPGADVRVVPNGVDTDRIVPGAHETDRARARVVFVGTLKPWHGVEHLVDSVSRASADWDLVVVGDGPQRASLQAAVAVAGLGGRVTFTGAVAPAQVGPLLAGADLAVAPYPEVPQEQSYFSPLKVFEYLAAGLPVVASAIGQIPRILAGTGAGVLVPPSDPQALAEAIDGLVTDPAARRRMARAARERAVQAHSWTAAVDAILADLRLGTARTPARAAA